MSNALDQPNDQVNTRTNIQVVGVGLEGASSLIPDVLEIVKSATVLVGARRHLDSCRIAQTEEQWPLGNFSETFDRARSHLTTHPTARVVILASADPLFFGIGRLLLEAFPADQLTFHPQVSAIQLAFSRLKIPWQSATLISVHGRGEALLTKALKRGDDKIAVLTDPVLTPNAIAQLITSLELPIHYQIWVCENLGADTEKLSLHDANAQPPQIYSALNVVVLLRAPMPTKQEICPLTELPLIGLPDSAFKGFPDRPTLMTKREIRLLILGAIAPLPHQVIWDIGAGTGSVSIELSRLCPSAQIYAVEKTAIGAELIRQNADRLAIAPIKIIQAKAPDGLSQLPMPDRVFIGGSSGQLTSILDYLHQQLQRDHTLNPHADKLQSSTRIVLALATIENISEVICWVNNQNDTVPSVPQAAMKGTQKQLSQTQISQVWTYQLMQVNIARSLPVGPLTRFSPLNPVTIITLSMDAQLK